MSFQFVITVLWVAFHVPVVIHLKEQPLTSGIAPKRYPSMPSSKTAKEHPGPLSCRAEMQLLTKGHLLNHTWEIDLLLQSVILTHSEAGGWELVTRGVVFSLHLSPHKVYPAFTYNQLVPRCESSTLLSSTSECLFYFITSMISTCQVTKNERQG